MKQFNNIVIVLLISVFISDPTYINELGRTPFLIRHYFEHHNLHPKDSFFNFLYKHYIQHQKADSEADRKSDMQLPFKSSHLFHADLSPFILEGKVDPVIIEKITDYYLPLIISIPHSLHLDTWHPPKII